MTLPVLKQVVCAGILSFWTTILYGQLPYEVKIASANDNYCLQKHDGYYTNGLFLRVNYLPHYVNPSADTVRKLTKVTAYYQVGQMMFTPELLHPLTTSQVDRPYAGYLFVQKGMSFFYAGGHVLNANVSVGTMGRASLAEQAQLLVHKTLNLESPNARLWMYQVKNEPGLNLQLQYWHELMPVSRHKRWFDLHGTSQFTIGNTFTNASAGLLFQAGLFERPNHSSLYDARLERQPLERQPTTARKSTELYVFIRPTYQYQVYNATVQGRLFEDNSGSIVAPINHWSYMHDIGIVYAQRRWTFQLMYSYKEKEALTMRHSEQYVTITAAYCFHGNKGQ